MKGRGPYGKKYLDIQTRTQEIAAPDEDHVIVQVKACGVCGTDVNFVRDWDDDYMPLGHEIAGEVVETGKNVTGLRPGDKVIVEDCSMCGHLRRVQERPPRVLPPPVQHGRTAWHGRVHVCAL